MVDCEDCRNYDSAVCMCCEHGDIEIDDHYDPISETEKQERRKKWLERIPAEIITAILSEQTLKAYESAKLFTDYQELSTIDYANAVFFGTDYIAATDSFRLVEIKDVDVPKELQGKLVLSIEGDQARCMTQASANPFANENYKRVMGAEGFEEIKDLNLLTVSDVISDHNENIYLFSLGDKKIYIKKCFFKDAFTVLADLGTFNLFYRDNMSPIRFEGGNVTILILPVRV